MKCIILAGGYGTRLAEETKLKPKPLVKIGSKPIIWHLMKIYSHFGIKDFIICLGYKGKLLKKEVNYLNRDKNWNIKYINTGLNTMTGGRIKRVKDYIGEDEDFCLTYGDGLANINITELIRFHKSHRKAATLSSVFPPGRFGAVEIKDSQVTRFSEKPSGDGALINGGFFVLNKRAINYIKEDSTIWEQEPLNTLATTGELMSFKHENFWQPMDTLRDKYYLEELWESNKAPWKLWS